MISFFIYELVIAKTRNNKRFLTIICCDAGKALKSLY